VSQEVSRIGVERVIPIRFVSLVPSCNSRCDPAKVCAGDAGCDTSTTCGIDLLQTAASRSGGVVSQGAYSTHTACLFGTCNTYRVRVLQVWSPDDGVWYTYDAWSGLAGSPTTCAFGGPGDVPVSGFVDRDNNGTSDYVIYRALETDGTINSSGTMYFRRDDCTTDTTISSASFNARDIVSASGDISGDGQSDIFRIKKDTMTWYVLFNINSTGYSSTSFSLGAIGAIPL
jgi:hypothetical protein